MNCTIAMRVRVRVRVPVIVGVAVVVMVVLRVRRIVPPGVFVVMRWQRVRWRCFNAQWRVTAIMRTDRSILRVGMD